MAEDSPVSRPGGQPGDPPEDDQTVFLDDLNSLFDEESEDEPGLPSWGDGPSESEAGGWDSLGEVSPRWREDAEFEQAPTDLPAPAGEVQLSRGSSVFEDPEPTEAVELPSVDRVDEVLSLDDASSPTAYEMTLTAPSPVVPESRPPASNGNPMAAIAVGLVLGGVVLGAVALGERVTLAVLAIAVLIAAAEWFTTLRQAGYQPPTLVGFAAVVAMPLAAYWRGADGIIMVLVFALFGAGLWYLGGVGRDRPLVNLGIALLGIAYIGVTGAFGGLLLDAPDGAELVLTAVILTAAHDVGAYTLGRAAGRTPLSAASPNKTVEGLIGGTVLTIASALVFISILGIGPFGADTGSRSDGVILGIVVAVVAPLADLLESTLKRDLRVKDMGSLLPGHGGVLDRIDALLFVLPATYFTALMLEVI